MSFNGILFVSDYESVDLLFFTVSCLSPDERQREKRKINFASGRLLTSITGGKGEGCSRVTWVKCVRKLSLFLGQGCRFSGCDLSCVVCVPDTGVGASCRVLKLSPVCLEQLRFLHVNT